MIFTDILMNYLSLDIAFASFCAALSIGVLSLWFGRLSYCPMTVLYIPALLPMIPGMYAYRAVFALMMFMHKFCFSCFSCIYCLNLPFIASINSVTFTCFSKHSRLYGNDRRDNPKCPGITSYFDMSKAKSNFAPIIY